MSSFSGLPASFGLPIDILYYIDLQSINTKRVTKIGPFFGKSCQLAEKLGAFKNISHQTSTIIGLSTRSMYIKSADIFKRV